MTLAQHSMETVEQYTPQFIVEPSRMTLGGTIGLDPASCPLGQEVVRAARWYGAGSRFGPDGLKLHWSGNVFLNPPGGLTPDRRSLAAFWWNRLERAYDRTDVEAAVFVGFTLEIMRSTQAFGGKTPMDFSFCIPKARIPFDTPNRIIEKGKKKGQLIDPRKPLGVRVSGTSPAHANVIVYLGDENDRFFHLFKDIGQVKLR